MAGALAVAAALMAVREHADTLLALAEVTMLAPALPCFAGQGNAPLDGLRQRLMLDVPDEELRDRGVLTVIDTYDALLDFTASVPTVFISHQWLGFGAPDPEGVHYRAIIASVRKLAKEEGLDESEVHVWLE